MNSHSLSTYAILTHHAHRRCPSGSMLVAALTLLLGMAHAAWGGNLALRGDGILGVKGLVDSDPGISLYQAGNLANINDGDVATRVDNWSGGNDGGRGISYVGVLWPSVGPAVVRYELITDLKLTLAGFGDGGWFGPTNQIPPGNTLTAAYLTQPTVQVSTNGGTNWSTVAVTSDYLTALDGLVIGVPTPLTTTFTLTPAITNINGVRIIGPNGGRAGSDPNGFLGVFELEINSGFTDNDSDLMPDAWERVNALNDTVNDSSGDADADGLINLGEYQADTNPQDSDTDGDGYSDGVELSSNSDPKDSASIPGNLARDGTGILGTRNEFGDTPLFHGGVGASINDANLSTRVDTWNGGYSDSQSYVGITWAAPQPNPVLRLELTLATFGDGGWFGPNNKSPVAGGALNPTYLTEPTVQVTTDGGGTWSPAPHISDYLTVMNGHRIGGGGVPNPSTATATFILDPPVANINGIRIIGSEGGTASGGFLGVSELKVYAKTDADGDGMDDDWERKHGLVVGVKDGAGDLDLDGLTNLLEYQGALDPQNPDSDADGLKDGEEVNTHHTNPASADSDTDGLKDGEEINTFGTNPLAADTDGDWFLDGMEVQLGSLPTHAGNTPSNFARRGDASGILGTQDEFGMETLVFNAGAALNIHDGNLATRVDSYRNAPDTNSFVGIVWANSVTNALTRLELNLATFFDGGWFGVNNLSPGGSGVLSSNTHLLEPIVQISTDGVTWIPVAFTSDYLAVLNGHVLPPDWQPPTLATAHFQLTPPQSGIKGVRILGSEGGTASGGFLGVFELAALTGAASPVMLLNPAVLTGQLRFEFDTQSGGSYDVQFKTALNDATWQTLTSVTGDGTRKTVLDPIVAGPRFYRVVSK